MTTTFGKLDPPFGKTRLQVMKMFSAILQTNSEEVNEEFQKLGTLQAMWVRLILLLVDFLKGDKCLVVLCICVYIQICMSA